MKQIGISEGRKKSKKSVLISVTSGVSALTILAVIIAILLSTTTYLKVSEMIVSLIDSDVFISAVFDDKVEMMGDKLQELVEDGFLEEDSIIYSVKDKLFSFKYDDGSWGGVDLSDDDDLFEHVKEIPSPDGETHIDSDSNNQELKGYMCYGLGYPEVLHNLEVMKDDWSNIGLETSIQEECTVELFKTELSGYDYLSISLHGSIYDDVPVICLEEKVTDSNTKKYKEDIKKNRIAIVTTIDGNTNYWIMPEFIRYYYGGSEKENFDGTIVWLSCCYGYYTDDLVDAFSDCGADIVTGYTNSVYSYYDLDLQNRYVQELVSGQTAREALTTAKNKYGNDDYDWAKSVNIVPDKEGPAECKIYIGEECVLE